MTCKRYKGEKITFTLGKRIGKGGNGIVYLINIIDGDIDGELVVKVLNYISPKKIVRFRREIDTLKRLTREGITGIISIVDMCCPENVTRDDEIWYVMHKAEPYKIQEKKPFLKVLQDMLYLARTLSVLHKNGIAHRDIKPENIMIYNNQLMLTDFGLVWTVNSERITNLNERLGPYKIMPPELEEYDGDEDIQYTSSDVYLFAKVLWMMIRNDSNGFRGQYNRTNSQIYIDKDRYGITAQTIEPIHRLLEEATGEINERITIDQCIEYIEEQIRIILGEISEQRISYYCFQEEINKQKADINPDSIIIVDRENIEKLLQNTIVKSTVSVRFVNDKSSERRIREIVINDIRFLGEREIQLIQYRGNDKPLIIRMKIQKVEIITKSNEMIIQIDKMDRDIENSVSWHNYYSSPVGPYNCVVLQETEEVHITPPYSE